MFTSLLQRLSRRPPRDCAGRARRKARLRQALDYLPRLEVLESRVVPSSGHPRGPFGMDGTVTTDFTGFVVSEGDHVLVQPDGKIVLAGTAGNQFALVRYNTNGALDTSFDGDGRATTGFPIGMARASSAALQSDGKIVVVGTAMPIGAFVGDFALARFDANGALDTTFGAGGRVTTDFGGADSAAGVAIQSDGKIVVVGDTAGNFALARYHANGSPDTSFDGDGKLTTNFGAFDSARGVAIQSDGKIVAAGGSGGNFALARYNAGDGSLDMSFDGDGKVATDFGGSETAWSVAIQSDGMIVAAGGTFSSVTFDLDFALARYDANGGLDAGFDGDGKVTTDFAVSDDFATGVAIQSDGKIVAAGDSLNFDTFSQDFAAARYNADGSLDMSFDGDGKVTTFVGGFIFGESVALQSDGKIVQAGGSGSIVLVRYNANGSLDTSFDTDGIVITSFEGSQDDTVSAIALQPDGKTVAVGISNSSTFFVSTGFSFSIARYNADGTLDTSFGTGGKVTTDFGFDSAAWSVAIQPDGKIVVAGTTLNFDDFTNDIALARYNRDGSLDTSFGAGGQVTIDFGSYESAYGVVLQSDGKIVVGGEFFNFDTFTFDFALVRLNSNGALDSSFGAGGKSITDFGGNDSAYDVAILPNGKIVAAGRTFSFDTFQYDFALACYHADGTLVTSFGVGGKVTTDFGGNEFTTGVAVQPNGKIVVVGGISGDFALARYNGNGSLDTSFDIDGKVTTDFGGSDTAWEVAVQPNGKIVAVGSTTNPATFVEGFALARYNTNGSLDTSFDGDGRVATYFGTSLIAAAFGVAIRPDGKIVAGGDVFSTVTFTFDFGMARYNTDGSLDGSPLRAAAPGRAATQDILTSEQVPPLLAEAVRRWQATGAETSGLASINFRIVDLGGDLLGLASGDTIWLDDNAAGWGWYVDATPWEDSEFTTPGDQGEQGKMDLLTALAHELGHLLGHDHDDDGIMIDTLTPGIRRMPGGAELNEWSTLVGVLAFEPVSKRRWL